MIKAPILSESSTLTKCSLQRLYEASHSLGSHIGFERYDYLDTTEHYIISRKESTTLSNAGSLMATISVGKQIPKYRNLHSGETLSVWNLKLSRNGSDEALEFLLHNLMKIAEGRKTNSICIKGSIDIKNSYILSRAGFIARNFAIETSPERKLSKSDIIHPKSNLETYYTIRL
jgi:hypothetical protein